MGLTFSFRFGSFNGSRLCFGISPVYYRQFRLKWQLFRESLMVIVPGETARAHPNQEEALPGSLSRIRFLCGVSLAKRRRI